MTALIVQSGKHRGKQFVLPQTDVIVGRDDDCQIRLATKEISRHHCIFKQTANGVTVTDLGSQNGTLVNNSQIVEETLLNAGDLLQVGPIVFRVAGKKKSLDEAPASQASSATDDDIASWLTDDSTDDGTLSSETTIIQKRSEILEPDASPPADDLPQVAEPVATPEAQPSEDAPPPSKRRFHSVAEEGADIIRRHLEMIREKD